MSRAPVAVILFAALLAALPVTPVLQQDTFGLSPATAAAQSFVPLVTPPPGSVIGNVYSTNFSDLSSFVNGLFRFAIVVGALGAVIRLAWAGYLYMGQADMWSHKGAARAIIGDVTLGLLLLLAVWLILNQINPDILSLKALQSVTPTQSQ